MGDLGPARWFAFEAPVEVTGSWRFVILPQATADEIDDRVALRGGFGSIKVDVRLGDQEWRTSLFPAAKRESFFLPLKAAVRDAEGVDDGDVVSIEVRPLDLA